MSLLGSPLDPASLSEVFSHKLSKCPSTPCVSPVIWIVSARGSVILFQLAASHQAFSGLKDPKTPTLSLAVTLPSGRVLCYCALSTGATRGSGSPPGPRTGPASIGDLLSSQPHLPRHLIIWSPWHPLPSSSCLLGPPLTSLFAPLPRLSGDNPTLSWGLKESVSFSTICSISRGQVLFLCCKSKKKKESPLTKPVDLVPSHGAQLRELSTGCVLGPTHSCNLWTVQTCTALSGS